MKITTIIGCMMMTLSVVSYAQNTTEAKWSLKNNLLYDATLTPNLGIEVVTGKHTSAQMFYGLHPWQFSNNKKLRHWSVMPEWRYWLQDCGPMEGWFWGIHLVGGEYNIGGKKLPLGLFKPLRHNRYEGWYGGGGLTLGYAWLLADHWRMEAAAGLGYAHTRYHKYESPECGADLGTGHYNHVGLTKLALNLAYVFGKKKAMAEKPVINIVEPPVVKPYEPQYQMTFVTPKAEAEKSRNLSGRAFLDFVVNKTDIRPDYRGNTAELAKVQQTIDVVRKDPNTTITHISIHGYASPESPYDHNTYLAKARAQAFKDYVQMLMALPASIFSVASTPEDWEGLLTALGEPKNDLGKNHEAVLAIAKSDMAPDEKERQLKRQYPKEWKQLLSDVFPALRHSDYEVSYTVRPFTVEEARELIRTKPQQLSLNEMFMVANIYTPGSQDYNEVFEIAVRMFPTDETANLNAAIIAMKKKDLDAAGRYLEKAGDSPETLNLRGMIAVEKGDYSTAEKLFQKSGTDDAMHNLNEMKQYINSIH